jgi:peptide-methionine (S)-S-oxide reductase
VSLPITSLIVPTTAASNPPDGCRNLVLSAHILIQFPVMARENNLGKTEAITLGGGCFWCLEAGFELIRGVTKVTSGYAGGQVANPTYEAVCGGGTGHAEVVRVEFDPSVISLEDILDIFWAMHDPTTPNRQGSDVGTQYRSAIFYHDAAQKEVVELSAQQAAKLWNDPIVTEVKPLEQFYPAEEYHQDYFRRNPSQAYCQIIINPKLQKLRQKFATQLA